MNDMIFEGLVDESEVGKLREGMQLVLNVGALEGKPFAATLEFISPKGTTDQGTIKFTIRAAVKLDKELFLPLKTTVPMRTLCSPGRRTFWPSTKANLMIEDKASFVEVESGPQGICETANLRRAYRMASISRWCRD